jgi:hypothetical protein
VPRDLFVKDNDRIDQKLLNDSDLDYQSKKLPMTCTLS